MNWWDPAIAVAGGVVLIYAVLLVLLALYPSSPGNGGYELWSCCCSTLASPIDLVPDFLPIIGYADDVIIVALALRSVIRKAGNGPVEQHWPEHPPASH